MQDVRKLSSSPATTTAAIAIPQQSTEHYLTKQVASPWCLTPHGLHPLILLNRLLWPCQGCLEESLKPGVLPIHHGICVHTLAVVCRCSTHSSSFILIDCCPLQRSSNPNARDSHDRGSLIALICATVQWQVKHIKMDGHYIAVSLHEQPQ